MDVEVERDLVAGAAAALSRRDAHRALDDAQAAADALARVLLPGHDASWIASARDARHALRLDALETLARAALLLGGSHLSVAERASRELVAIAPFRETAYAALMEALAAAGNDAEALRSYEELRLRLRDELGTAPGAVLQALHRRLLGSEDDERTEVANLGTSLPLPASIATATGTSSVGRELELTALRAALARAVQGRCEVAIVTGEAGVGKTHLCAAIALTAHARGVSILYGRCDADPLVPFQPFVEALRQVVMHADDELLAPLAAHGGSAQLARLVPELGERIAGAPVAAEHERYWLLEAIATLLAAQAERAPLLLVLDDVHWADSGTLLALRRLARHPSSLPLLVVATSRSDVLSAEHPLVGALQEVRRSAPVERIRVGRLGRENVGALIEALVGVTPSEPFVATVHELTGGNPLFVEETVRLALERAGPDVVRESGLGEVGLAGGVRDLIEVRLQSLEPEARRVLGVASILGSRIELDLLASVAAITQEEALTHVESALRAGILVELSEAPDAYAFDNAVVRETLNGELLASKRARLHRRAAEAIADIGGGEERVAELAHHSFLGGRKLAPGSVAWPVAAGERALDMLAYEEAAAHFERALEALDTARLADLRRRCNLELGLGASHDLARDRFRANEAYDQALAAARELEDPELVAAASLGRAGRFRWVEAGRVDPDLISVLEYAVAHVPADTLATRARLQARLGAELAYSDEARAREICTRAVAGAREASDPVALGETLTAQWRMLGPAELEQRRAIAAEIVELADRAGDQELSAQGRIWHFAISMKAGDMAEADRDLAQCVEHVDRIRVPTLLWAVESARANRALVAGDLVEAEACSERAFELGVEGNVALNAAQGKVLQLMLLREAQGRLAELFEPVSAVVASVSGLAAWRAALSWIALRADREDEARAHLEDVVGSRAMDMPEYSVSWLAALTAVSYVIADLGDRVRAKVVYDALLPYADRVATAGFQAACFGAVARPLGLLAATLGEHMAADLHLTRAAETHGRIGAPGLRADTLVDHARTLLRSGVTTDGERAAAMLTEATELAERHGHAGVLGRARACSQLGANG